MAVNFKLRGGDRVPASSPAKIPCLLGTCPLGVVGQSYAFDPGDNVVGTLGGGKLAQFILYLHATTGSRVVCVPTAGTYPALPSVTSTGATPPAVTLALAPGNPVGGAYDHFDLLLNMKIAGVGGAAQFDLMYDGNTVAETRIVPAELPAKVVGTAAITPATLALANGLTLVTIDPAVETLTLPAGSLGAVAAGLKTATATVAAPVTLHAADLIPAGVTATHANVRKIRFTTAGMTPSDAPASVTVTGLDYTGASQNETLNLSQSAAAVSTVKAYDLTTCTIAYLTADGTGATIAIGYEDAYASVAELVAELNTLAVAAPLAAVFTDEQTTAGHFLGVATTAAGTSALLELNSSSTALTLFGLTASVITTGAAATLTLPFTGLQLTFPATGAYPVPGTYSASVDGPRSSVSALQTAAVAAHDQYATNPFGFLATVETFDTMANAAAALSALNSLTATWMADPAAPLFTTAIVGTVFHVASAVKATNDTNIVANDAAFIAAFPPSTPDTVLNNVAHDDVYIPGAAGLPAGTYRRPATWCAASKVAGAAKIAANPGDGGVGGAQLVGADGVTRARNENTATTKLGGLGGAGAWVLKSTSAGLGAPSFEVCASRAGASSRLRDPGAIFIGLEIERIVFGEIESWNAQTWEGDALNPIAADISETEPRAHHLEQLLRQTLQPDPGPSGAGAGSGGPPNVSNFDVIVTAPTLGNDEKVSVQVPFNPLNVVGIVNVAVTATGAAITSGG